MCRLSWNLGASTSWNPQGLSRPVMGLLYLHYTTYSILVKWEGMEVVLFEIVQFQNLFAIVFRSKPENWPFTCSKRTKIAVTKLKEMTRRQNTIPRVSGPLIEWMTLAISWPVGEAEFVMDAVKSKIVYCVLHETNRINSFKQLVSCNVKQNIGVWKSEIKAHSFMQLLFHVAWNQSQDWFQAM